jgi:H+/Cl- antiporter ClcA
VSDHDTPIDESPVTATTEEPRPADPSRVSLQWLSSRARRLSLSEGNLFLLLAIIIGIFSGMAVVCFRIAIEWVRLGLLGSALAPPHLRVLLVPAAVGLVVAFLVQKFFPAARGSGVNQTKAAVYVFDGYVPFRTVLG